MYLYTLNSKQLQDHAHVGPKPTRPANIYHDTDNVLTRGVSAGAPAPYWSQGKLVQLLLLIGVRALNLPQEGVGL